MATIGQALQPGYYWSGTRVCAGPGAARYIGAVTCWEYTRAPADVFAAVFTYPSVPRFPPIGTPIPIIPPPPTTTGGSGSRPAPITVGRCGSCKQPSPPLEPSNGGSPSVPATLGTPGVSGERYPWWVFVLAILILAQVIDNG